jgi:hypothetical protein
MSESLLVRITRSVRRRRLEKSLVELQKQLDWIDWRPRIRVPDADTDIAGKRVKTLRGIRIRMNGSKNHKRPHVHVDYGKRVSHGIVCNRQRRAHRWRT